MNDGVLPSRTLAIRSGVNISAVNRHGGLRHLGGYLHLTGETVVAFFIALSIQTAAIRMHCDWSRATARWRIRSMSIVSSSNGPSLGPVRR
ncbi:hypothetical protein [Sinorhizobium psoraleae]|uniref:Uncharacterized protein n=1 Tax=Sinorhizobium psoraleae TaxID=520838 RepID=A0ABT4KA07_9HYPH|nr:hypothetical protein [Sinorhizobium psoraleae]MCZ4088664.1 hypothetical protein [Sinorhizobium psoraleae]